MREREHTHDEQTHDQSTVSPAPALGGNRDELRTAAERLLAVGDDAIQRALSTNSERFLAANQQQGGQ